MKTLCLLDSISRANGGIFEAEKRLQQSLQATGKIDVQVVGLRDAHTEADLPSWAPLSPLACPIQGPSSFGYAPELLQALLHAQVDLAYFVGLWKYPSFAALRWARRTGKPYLVAPHGMLDPWAVQNSGTKKRIAAWLFQNEHLQRASCLRALCAAEAASIRAYGLKNPICIIPNGIDLPSPSPASDTTDFPFSPGRKTLLYLGRIHPKKGLANLIQAWSNLPSSHRQEWALAIAGWDQGGHEAELKQKATDLGILWADPTSRGQADTSLLFLGPQFGDAKKKIYSQSQAFILPSFSEGLPMVILEAWAYGKPVLMTPACNLPEGFAAQAALRIEPQIDSIAAGLSQFFQMRADVRLTMGSHGLALVKERFAWSRLADEMSSVYAWMLHGDNKPNCIVTA